MMNVGNVHNKATYLRLKARDHILVLRDLKIDYASKKKTNHTLLCSACEQVMFDNRRVKYPYTKYNKKVDNHNQFFFKLDTIFEWHVVRCGSKK